GPDDVLDLVDELPGEPLELLERELGGIAGDAALGAAEGEVHDGALPGHEAREALELVVIDLGVEAQPALERAAAVVVLDPVAAEGADLPRVELDRDLDLHLPEGGGQQRLDALAHVHGAGSASE